MRVNECKVGMIVLATKKSVCNKKVYNKTVDERYITFLKDCPLGICRIGSVGGCKAPFEKQKGTIIGVVPLNANTQTVLHNEGNYYCFRAKDLKRIK